MTRRQPWWRIERGGTGSTRHQVTRVHRPHGDGRRLASNERLARGGVRRPVERRQVVAAQSARAPQGVRPSEQDAWSHTRDQLLQGERRVRAGRPSGLRVCANRQGTQGRMAAADRRLSARIHGAARRGAAARRAAPSVGRGHSDVRSESGLGGLEQPTVRVDRFEGSFHEPERHVQAPAHSLRPHGA